MGALSPGAVHLLPSAVPASVSARWWGAPCVCSGELVSSCDLPSGQMSAIPDVNHPESPEIFGQKLEARLQFGRGCHLWGRDCPFPLPLPPASSGGWAGPLLASSSLELLSLSFVPKQCHPLLSVQPPLAGGGCQRLGYFSARRCFQACDLWVLLIFPPSQVAL